MTNSNEINARTCSLVFEQIGRRGYVNSERGRIELLRDCETFNRRDLYADVLAVWGENPTVHDDPLSPEPTIEGLKAQKKAEIAAARYEVETGGCTVDGVSIATDRGSQALLTAAVVMARLDPEFKTQWKCTDGHFKQLDAFQLRTIGDAVIAHVEACFAREGELCELIDAAQSAEDLAAIRWSL